MNDNRADCVSRAYCRHLQALTPLPSLQPAQKGQPQLDPASEAAESKAASAQEDLAALDVSGQGCGLAKGVHWLTSCLPVGTDTVAKAATSTPAPEDQPQSEPTSEPADLKAEVSEGPADLLSLNFPEQSAEQAQQPEQSLEGQQAEHAQGAQQAQQAEGVQQTKLTGQAQPAQHAEQAQHAQQTQHAQQAHLQQQPNGVSTLADSRQSFEQSNAGVHTTVAQQTDVVQQTDNALKQEPAVQSLTPTGQFVDQASCCFLCFLPVLCCTHASCDA